MYAKCNKFDRQIWKNDSMNDVSEDKKKNALVIGAKFVPRFRATEYRK